jgi:long-chain acyl-CoA synthetase
MHRSVAESLGPRIALRYRQNGVYRDLSWVSYRRQADQVACGLLEMGMRSGDRVGLLSENRYEWLVADIAILTTGAIHVPLHAPLTAAQVQYQLAHSGVRGVIVSNQTQADKVFGVLEALPALEFLVAFDPITVRRPIQHVSWNRLVHRGRQIAASRAGELLARESSMGRHDVATIIYTSGTTGNPKGVMLTHGNFISNAEAMVAVSDLHPDDILLSWLPYSHVYARTVDHYLSILVGATVCLAGSADTLFADLEEARPTWMTAVPRFYEKIWSCVQHLAGDARRAELQRIFGPRLRWLSSGGAPLPRHIGEGFLEAGIMLLEGYGLTESSPVISFNKRDCFKVGTVGRPIPGIEVKIADDGEILTRGPHVMKGYWNDPGATAEVIRDGWLHTGDVGRLDGEGFLAITDRKKDLIITSGGKNIAPADLERLLAADEYIDQAVIYGDGRQFLSALVVPQFEKLTAVAKQLGCTLNTSGEFIDCPPIHDFLAGRIARVMEVVSPSERVKRFVILARPLQLAADELTATLKVRRRSIVRKFQDRLNALYDD